MSEFLSGVYVTLGVVFALAALGGFALMAVHAVRLIARSYERAMEKAARAAQERKRVLDNIERRWQASDRERALTVAAARRSHAKIYFNLRPPAPPPGYFLDRDEMNNCYRLKKIDSDEPAIAVTFEGGRLVQLNA